MIYTEEMSTAAAKEVVFPKIDQIDLKKIPSRMEDGRTPRKTSIEKKLDLLKKLVERVKDLEHVSVKNVPYLSKSGVVVELPGPWSLRLSGASTPTKVSTTLNNSDVRSDVKVNGDVDDEDNDNDDVEEDEEDNNVPEVDEDEEILQTLSQLNHREKFVVRNEFGHVRLSHLLDALENYRHNPLPPHLQAQLEIGGHCVLSEGDFRLCLEKKWGQPHPLAGRFHPIAGTMIPETTLLFFVPRTEMELETVWTIVLASYGWTLSGQQTKDQ